MYTIARLTEKFKKLFTKKEITFTYPKPTYDFYTIRQEMYDCFPKYEFLKFHHIVEIWDYYFNAIPPTDPRVVAAITEEDLINLILPKYVKNRKFLWLDLESVISKHQKILLSQTITLDFTLLSSDIISNTIGCYINTERSDITPTLFWFNPQNKTFGIQNPFCGLPKEQNHFFFIKLLDFVAEQINIDLSQYDYILDDIRYELDILCEKERKPYSPQNIQFNNIDFIFIPKTLKNFNAVSQRVAALVKITDEVN